MGQIRFVNTFLTDAFIQFLMLVWIFSMFFRELFPTKVILGAIGPKGSGKTTLLTSIGQLLFGGTFQATDITDDAKDLDAAITSEPFVVIDNADRKIKWLEDKLAVAATGGSVKRRDLYTTNRMVEFPIIAALGITSRTPYYRREDIADRLLPIEVERLERFVSAAHLREEIRRQRDILMTLTIRHLEKIVAALHSQRDEHPQSRFRMTDFAEFALKIEPALSVSRAEVEQILDQLSDVQLHFTVEEEPLLEVIDRWLVRPSNVAKWLSTSQLFKDLQFEAQTNPQIDFSIAGASSLGQRITNLRSTLERLYGYEQKPARSGMRLVRFRRTRAALLHDHSEVA
jgi:energy-coupling factor transporter ATP-binding protein EcfA2